jgi:23S rRNA (guanosine2251-2'-O)-methyltransferase
MEAALVYGRNPVLSCLRARKRRVRKLFLLRGGKNLGPLEQAAVDIPIEHVDRHTLDKLAKGGVHQGALLQADPLPVREGAAWLDDGLPDSALLMVLDGVEDPHNFGAIVRSAVACGAHAVIFGQDRAAPLSPTAVKSAAGAMEYIELVRAKNIIRFLGQLQDAGVAVVALDAHGDHTLWEIDLARSVALVVGSEGKGVRRMIKKSCDYLTRIPITGPITSLNASVSAAVVLTECLRQRHNSP